MKDEGLNHHNMLDVLFYSNKNVLKSFLNTITISVVLSSYVSVAVCVPTGVPLAAWLGDIRARIKRVDGPY